MEIGYIICSSFKRAAFVALSFLNNQNILTIVGNRLDLIKAPPISDMIAKMANVAEACRKNPGAKATGILKSEIYGSIATKPWPVGYRVDTSYLLGLH